MQNTHGRKRFPGAYPGGLQKGETNLNQRSFVIAIAVFALLLGYFLFLQSGNKGLSTVRLPGLDRIAAEDMERIEIIRPGNDRLVLERKDKTWNLAVPLQFPADKSKTEQAQRVLSEARITDLIAERPEAEADFGLTSTTAMSVLITGAKGRKLQLTLGKTNEAMTHTFVRLPGKPAIYQAYGDLVTPLKVPAAEWRSLQIFDQGTDGVQSVIIEQGKKSLLLARTEEAQPALVGAKGNTPPALPKRTVWKAAGVDKPLDETKVNPYLSTLTQLSAARIADQAPPAAKPLASLRFKTLTGEYGLDFLLHRTTDKRYLVRKQGEATVYELDEWQAKNLLKELKDFQ